ncbi:MAG TPA: RidA family protein [Intrasporangium sp.]|nr:RidA family protein [Intrasporangium sp.]
MRQRVSTGSPWEDLVGYSRAVRVGDTIHVSGTTAVRDGQVVGAGDAYTQTTVALEILSAALAELGATPADVVRTRMFVTDISRWEEYGRAHGEVFRDVRPTASMLEVSALIHPDLLVEIEAEAIVGGAGAPA